MEKPCFTCGRNVTFSPSRLRENGRIFCDSTCYHGAPVDASTRRHLKAIGQTALTKRWADHDMTPNTACAVCAAPLYRRQCERKGVQQHYCSPEHRAAGVAAARRQEKPRRPCETCGRAFNRRVRLGVDARFCSSVCYGISVRNPTIIKNGYALVLRPDHPDCDAYGYVREHRLAMEMSIGRRLTKREVVHHRNGVKTDNRIDNLELLPDNRTHLKTRHPTKAIRHVVSHTNS